ncbi:MAG: hypothetical protein ACLSWI_07460 [Candidatus Gastranaerophilaceae bacterium]
MASIKDAMEEAFTDNLSFIKYVVFTVPLYYCVYLFTSSKGDLTGFWWMASVTFLLLFGFFIKCTANVRNGLDHVLPSFNIFNLFWAGIKGVVALGPSIAINSWLASLLSGLVDTHIPDPNFALGFKIVIWAIFVSIMLTGYMQYSKNFKIADAYNFKTISNSCIDILIRVLFMVPIVLIIDAIIVGAITYVFWVFLGIPNPICTYFWCMAFVFNLAMIGNYMAQIDYETIEAKSERDI